MPGWLRRLSIGFLFAVPLALIAFAVVQTPTHAQSTDPSGNECGVCHPAFVESWEQSAHQQAADDPDFLLAWREQGEQETCLSCHSTGYDADEGVWQHEGIGCAVCHSSELGDHPLEPMAADRSAKFCGDCHTETFFEWQVSGHRQEELTCVGCHDAHSTSLKAHDASALCSTCHRDRASNFTHSAHSSEGLTCADCHLGPTDVEAGEGHGVRDHSFGVKLSTCNACHAYQMHDPVEVHPEPAASLEPEASAIAEAGLLSLEPGPINPLGFAILSGLVGMASGMVLAPWLERWYKRVDRDED